MSLAPWLAATRPKTLLASVAPVGVGTVLGAGMVAGGIDWPLALGCLLGALLIQIATNFANDAFDGLSGADEHRVGPTRAVAAGLISPKAMLGATALVLLAALAIGLWLSSSGGWPILVGGLISLVCAIAYTGGPYPLAYHGLGDAFVLLFFGWFAVLGSAWMQAPWVAPSAAAWLLATAVGLQATALIAINNIRDIATDGPAGKNTLAVRMGDRPSRWYHAGLHIGATACIAIALGPFSAPAVLAAAGGLLLSALVMRLQGPALNACLGLGSLVELGTAIALIIWMLP